MLLKAIFFPKNVHNVIKLKFNVLKSLISSLTLQDPVLKIYYLK